MKDYINSQWSFAELSGIHVISMKIIVLPLAELRIMVKLKEEIHFYNPDEFFYLFFVGNKALFKVDNQVFKCAFVDITFKHFCESLMPHFMTAYGLPNHYFAHQFYQHIKL